MSVCVFSYSSRTYLKYDGKIARHEEEQVVEEEVVAEVVEEEEVLEEA